MCSTAMSGNSSGHDAGFTVRARDAGVSSTLALSTEVSFLRRCLAKPAASRTTRSTAKHGVAANVDGVGRRSSLLAEVDSAGQFAHDHDVHAVQAIRLDRRGVEHRGVRHHRPQVREQAQGLPQPQQTLPPGGPSRPGPTSQVRPTAPNQDGIRASSAKASSVAGGQRVAATASIAAPPNKGPASNENLMTDAAPRSSRGRGRPRR